MDNSLGVNTHECIQSIETVVKTALGHRYIYIYIENNLSWEERNIQTKINR